MAATMKMMSTAYLMCFARNPAVTRPMRASTMTSIGNWNITPMASSSQAYIENTGAMRGRNLTCDVWKLAKN